MKEVYIVYCFGMFWLILIYLILSGNYLQKNARLQNGVDFFLMLFVSLRNLTYGSPP